MLLVCSSWYVQVAYLMTALTNRDNMPLLLRQHTLSWGMLSHLKCPGLN